MLTEIYFSSNDRDRLPVNFFFSTVISDNSFSISSNSRRASVFERIPPFLVGIAIILNVSSEGVKYSW